MQQLRKGLQDGIPIGLGYLSVSFTFGIISVSYGLTWWQTLLISMTNMTSAGQFAGVSIMASMGTYVEMALTQFIINLRYSLMSVSLSQKVNHNFKGIYRWLLGFGITDEVFAVAIGQKGKIGKSYVLGLIITPYIGWTMGTLLGAIFGNILPEMVSSALGIALYGMFIAIMVPPAKENKSIAIVILIAVFMSCCFQWIPVLKKVSVGFVVIICGVVASIIGAILYPIAGEEQLQKEVEE
ncbi:MAG: AzlC family ABC transporter permease [Eubacteriales bacterium]